MLYEVITFRPDLPEAAIEALLKAGGGRMLSADRRTGYRRVAIPPGRSEKAFVEEMTARPEVAAAQLNHIVYSFEGPDDIEYPLQWQYDAPEGGINVVQAWGDFTGANEVTGFNGGGVTVAVIDTGLAYKAFAPVPQAPEWERNNFV